MDRPSWGGEPLNQFNDERVARSKGTVCRTDDGGPDADETVIFLGGWFGNIQEFQDIR